MENTIDCGSVGGDGNNVPAYSLLLSGKTDWPTFVIAKNGVSESISLFDVITALKTIPEIRALLAENKSLETIRRLVGEWLSIRLEIRSFDKAGDVPLVLKAKERTALTAIANWHEGNDE